MLLKLRLNVQKKQRRFYSGKKKRHTFKSQVVVNQVTGEIICTAHGKGKTHDFQLFKDNRIPLNQEIKCLADKGYQGIHQFIALLSSP